MMVQERNRMHDGSALRYHIELVKLLAYCTMGKNVFTEIKCHSLLPLDDVVKMVSFVSASLKSWGYFLILSQFNVCMCYIFICIIGMSPRHHSRSQRWLRQFPNSLLHWYRSWNERNLYLQSHVAIIWKKFFVRHGSGFQCYSWQETCRSCFRKLCYSYFDGYYQYFFQESFFGTKYHNTGKKIISFLKQKYLNI